ncbi:MAG TPA: DEAD/DEAH box helicase [Gemmatimonadaceae bacterium]|nr:DEAD/DEAH box helicase [Gemmatimonadaceae bacterium]
MNFPLYERAERLGVCDGQSALIVAPTATGKSYIGREAITRALQRERGRTHAFLVPFRSLAAEIYDNFREALAGSDARVRIATGDHRDPVRPQDADLVVATYESFVALMRLGEFRPGVVVADEVHLIADDHRGPVVEGLFARLLASRRAQAMLALSAVIENGDELARWLGIPLVAGSDDDRPVPLALEHRFVEDLDEAMDAVLDPCRHGEQALVFCSSRSGAEKMAEVAAELIGEQLGKREDEALAVLADTLEMEHGPDAARLAPLLRGGVAYHHAGLPRGLRRAVEQAFGEERIIRVITCTPTLAAGVNLPAGVAIVRGVFRADVVRGSYRQVLLPSGEILNMLGRAARPNKVARGVGIALIKKTHQQEGSVKALVKAIKAGRGGRVESQLAKSFEGLMRFVLAVVVEHGEANREDVAAAYKQTLAYHADRQPLCFDRPFEEDMMEDLPSYEKVRASNGTIRLSGYRLSPAGVYATVRSGDHGYDVVLEVTDISCNCPAARRYYRDQICKHQACAIHDLLFDPRVRAENHEAHERAVYNCGHVFGPTLDAGTRLTLALDLLTRWRLIDPVPTGWRGTKLGDIAVATGFDLLLVHQVVQRVEDAPRAGHLDVATWAVADYFEREEAQRKWRRAVTDWLAEVDEKKIKLPTKYRGDFERGLDDLARVCLLYARAAEALGKPVITESAQRAAGAVRYGVAPELVPLMALALPQLGRTRCRALWEHGVTSVTELAHADPSTIADARRLPARYVREWIAQAREIIQARAAAADSSDQADQEFDELVSRFQLDPAALIA